MSRTSFSNNPDAFGGRPNMHEFVVDWPGCRVRNLSSDSDRQTIKVLVCRDRTRFTFTLQGPAGLPVEYDFVFRDGGRTLSGPWRQGSFFGPTAGAQSNE